MLGDDPPEASVPGEVVPAADFYDYADKYEDGKAELLVPAPLTDAETRRGARARGSARSRRAGARRWRGSTASCATTAQFLVNELNTIPGFTPISMYPKLWEASGLSYSALLDRLIDLALERHARRARRAGRQR